MRASANLQVDETTGSDKRGRLRRLLCSDGPSPLLAFDGRAPASLIEASDLLSYPCRPTLNFFIVVVRFNRVVDESANRRGVQKTYVQFVGNVEVFVKPAAS